MHLGDFLYFIPIVLHNSLKTSSVGRGSEVSGHGGKETESLATLGRKGSIDDDGFRVSL